MTNLPTGAIYNRVFALQTGYCMGSCFAYPVDGSYCLITAGHVLEKATHAEEFEIKLFKDGSWKKLSATPYFYSEQSWQEGDIDVVILKN